MIREFAYCKLIELMTLMYGRIVYVIERMISKIKDEK